MGVCFVKGTTPYAFEIEGIEQITHHTLIKFLLGQYFLYHSFGMVAGPLVDDVTRHAVGKVAGLWGSIVEGECFLHETVLQLIALSFVDEDGVAEGHPGLWVYVGHLCHQLSAEAVDGIGSSVGKSQHIVDFLKGLSGSTVVHHAQRIGDAQWREHHVFILAGFAEQVEGEVVVLLQLLAFVCRQGYFLRCIEIFLGE